MLDKDVRSLVDFVLDFKRVDFRNKRAMAMIKYTATNRYTGKVYLKYPRLLLADKKRIKVKRIWLNKASEPLVKAYEVKKKQYQVKNYKDYLKILREGNKKTGKVSFGKKYKKALKNINNYIDAEGKVEPAILAVELDICRADAYMLAKALQIRHDRPR